MAHRLIGHGAGPSKLVAVVMDKGWEQVVAALGILAAGAAYVPIAPDLPEERFLHLLSHAQATILVTQPGLASRLPRTPGIWRVVVDDALLETKATLGPPWWQTPEDLAYVIYTSGSTGLPKGVMIDHRGAVNTVVDINHRFGVGPSDRVLALSALGFDLSVYDIFGMLAVGGAIVIPPPQAQRAPWEWADLMEQHQVSVWNTVPALMEMLTTYVEGRGLRFSDSLRLVLMSGDWIPVTLPDRIRALAAQSITLIGMGGATEASIWSNYYRIHGFRVELGEIEAALLSHDSVTGAVVTAVDAGQGSKRLVAYATPAGLSGEELRSFLAGKLPTYMVPDKVVTLEEFPLTANGKVNRSALEG